MLLESEEKVFTMYHGTCQASAVAMVSNGWQPRSGFIGGNMGQSKYLYVTSDPENAMWFAEENGCNTILKISDIPRDFLKVDPEDGGGLSFQEMLSFMSAFKMPGSFVLTQPLGPEHFSML